MRLTMVEVETRSFSFRGIGVDQAQAREALGQAWRLHVQQTGADLDYVNPDTDGNVSVLEAGQGWRDDQVIVAPLIWSASFAASARDLALTFSGERTEVVRQVEAHFAGLQQTVEIDAMTDQIDVFRKGRRVLILMP